MDRRSSLIRREVLCQTAKGLLAGKPEELHKIPFHITNNNESINRCCIHHDRAVIRARIISALGFKYDQISDETILSELWENIPEDMDQVSPQISILPEACSTCPEQELLVTDLCRTCLDKSCQSLCPKDAISFHPKAFIDQDKCIKCGKCQSGCAYGAIVKTKIPCQEACPVKAIERNHNEPARIDPDKCIDCGKCLISCPFGAPVSPSYMGMVAKKLFQKEVPMVAMLAPSIQGQLPGTYKQLLNSLYLLGFDYVTEVASGAIETIKAEGQELTEQLEEGKGFMTSSCCPVYQRLAHIHIPDMVNHISETPSPLTFTGRQWKNKNIFRVFIGPCLGKKREARLNGSAEAVLTFEELGALLVAKGIQVEEQWDNTLQETWNTAPREGHNFAASGGVSKAVAEATGIKDDRIQKLEGIDRKAVLILNSYAKRPGTVNFDFLEVMACQEGCVGGPGNICSSKILKRSLEEFTESTVKS
ncbi:[Fe-Fe] hydrogenase large subunit C-terminal domain-containing protein [Spirochaeta cellobiosiphila]|uniref:[Fe-Fe] hydrogenase large subunit C-terminal domain-containing protein n=1 Tax=Spirochaeta cellobiosiphila TaxID=504483 RepID=UPI0004276E6A|nr:[Fe-Fe] hydrogenase large subunit C-terminal domain-containing protein [Spirochaeta cellobiosiphila]